MRRIISHCSEPLNPVNLSKNNNKRFLYSQNNTNIFNNPQKQIDLRPTHPVPLLNHFSINNLYGQFNKPSYRYAGVIYDASDRKYALNTDGIIPYKAIPVVFYNDLNENKDIISKYFRVNPDELSKRFLPNIDYQMTSEFINLLHFVTEMRFKLCMTNVNNMECFLKQKCYNSSASDLNVFTTNNDEKYRFLILDGRESLRGYNDIDGSYGTEEYLVETGYEDLLGWFECGLSFDDKTGKRYCKQEDFKYFRNENYNVISSYGLGATLIDQHTINMIRMAINFGQRAFENKYKEKYPVFKENQN